MRTYTVEFDNLAIAVATTDILEFLAADDKPCRLLGWEIGQTSDVGDVQEEGVRLRWVRGNTTSGTGGSAITPRPCLEADVAAGLACEAGNTTAATAGTAVNLATAPWNIRLPWDKWLPQDCEFSFGGTSLMVLRLVAAPADSLTFSGTCWIAEMA